MTKFTHKRFERPRHGKYTLIFPFNQATHDLAVQLNRQTSSGGSAINVNGPNHAN